MKSAEQRLSETRQHAEAIVARRLSELFQRLSILSGFWLRPDFELDELAIFTWPGCIAGPDLYDEVMRWLVDLAEESPEAVQLMRGRTFARATH
jgi:hypothetical protein